MPKRGKEVKGLSKRMCEKLKYQKNKSKSMAAKYNKQKRVKRQKQHKK